MPSGQKIHLLQVCDAISEIGAYWFFREAMATQAWARRPGLVRVRRVSKANGRLSRVFLILACNIKTPANLGQAVSGHKSLDFPPKYEYKLQI